MKFETGFDAIDAKADINNGDVVLVGARPAIGKTALGLNIALNNCRAHKGAVGIFSFELLASEISSRMLASEFEIDYQRIKMHELNDEDIKRLNRGVCEVTQYPIYISDEADLTVNDICEKARGIHEQEKLALIMVDYIQLVRSPNNLHQLKDLARELDCTVFVLSQMHKNGGFRLHESSLEVADTKMIIEREEDKPAQLTLTNKKKQSYKVPLGWRGRFVKFENKSEENL